MARLRGLALISLGIAFCIGCGDSSSQSWETGKPQASGTKKAPKIADTADNDDSATADASDNPHKMANPHAGMQMPGGGPDQVMDNDGTLDIEAVHFTAVPKSWIRKAPKSPILQAEYAVPKADGDKDDGRLTISQANGSVEDNIARWKGQFSKKLDKDKQETIDAGGVKITLVDLTGTFDDSRGMMGPTVTRPGYRMFGAIFQVPNEQGLHFVKCYGPEKTMAARASEIKGFLGSLKVDK